MRGACRAMSNGRASSCFVIGVVGMKRAPYTTDGLALDVSSSVGVKVVPAFCKGRQAGYSGGPQHTKGPRPCTRRCATFLPEELRCNPIVNHHPCNNAALV